MELLSASILEESGRNRTPDKLPPDERNALYAPCDKALSRIVANCRPGMILGVGKFAESRAKDVLGDNIPIGTVLHPSPASPIANRGWSEQAEKQLAVLAAKLDSTSPLSVLARGYSVTQKQGKVVNSIEQLLINDTIVTQLNDGEVTSKITEISAKDD